MLAHALGRALPCPVVSRDERKEGMVHAHGAGFDAAPGSSVARLALLEGGVTVVPEAAFQNPAWQKGLGPLAVSRTFASCIAASIRPSHP
jgi:hypothetical protein